MTNISTSSSSNYGTTYDLTHGWLMWVHMGPRTWSDDTQEVLQYTKDGQTFGTFPVPWWVKGVDGRCLETLDNGGDIFMAGRASAYIFRNNDSTWERQPEVPDMDYDYDYDYDGSEGGGKLKCYKKVITCGNISCSLF